MQGDQTIMLQAILAVLIVTSSTGRENSSNHHEHRNKNESHSSCGYHRVSRVTLIFKSQDSICLGAAKPQLK